jgi:tRNA-uridine 2-sulfurtransferase
MARVAVAMSGGVDSAVAAALLVARGDDVVGFTMNLWPAWVAQVEGGHGCCGLGAIEDARAAARTLGIPHYVLNLREEFERDVIGYFAAEYARGRTPNPCIACNRAIKFSLLLQRVLGLGMDALATGHYARVDRDPVGRVRLRRAVDRGKDQSYVLSCLTQEQLARLCFPVGEYTKSQVREIARRHTLHVADKPDSQEICFVPSGDYADVVARLEPRAAQPGPIYDPQGRQVGEHRGLARYTVGQRRGLGIPGGSPRYVVAIDAERNALVVGDEASLRCPELVAGDLNWIAIPALTSARSVTARIRHAGADLPAVVAPDGPGRARVTFPERPRAAAPGQAIAFYDGDIVVGGGVIQEVRYAGAGAARGVEGVCRA